MDPNEVLFSTTLTDARPRFPSEGYPPRMILKGLTTKVEGKKDRNDHVNAGLSIKVVEAVYRSASEKRWVEITT